jgi:hypothetical protein
MSKQDRKDKVAAARPAPEKMTIFREYFWANLIFWAFLTLLSFVVWWSCSDPNDDPAVKAVLAETFKFIIYLFGFGFTLVSLFDAAYDFFVARAEDDGNPANSSLNR